MSLILMFLEVFKHYIDIYVEVLPAALSMAVTTISSSYTPW